LLSQDALYDNIPFPNIHGREAVRQAIIDFGFGKEHGFIADDPHRNMGNVVMTERVDTFTHTNGRTMTVPVMGTFTVKDGFIVVWRDYFDALDHNRQIENLSVEKFGLCNCSWLPWFSRLSLSAS